METIDNIGREEGNPRHQPVSNRPKSIFNAFHKGSGSRLLAMALTLLGLLLVLIGSITFILPLVFAGLALGIISGLAYMWSKMHALTPQ